MNVGETLLAAQLEQAGIPFEREFRFDPDRKFRADFVVWVYPSRDILIEIEGGVWSRGRHVRGAGFGSGCEKQARAMILGFRYLRATTEQVEDGSALEWIRALLAR